MYIFQNFDNTEKFDPKIGFCNKLVGVLGNGILLISFFLKQCTIHCKHTCFILYKLMKL